MKTTVLSLLGMLTILGPAPLARAQSPYGAAPKPAAPDAVASVPVEPVLIVPAPAPATETPVAPTPEPVLIPAPAPAAPAAPAAMTVAGGAGGTDRVSVGTGNGSVAKGDLVTVTLDDVSLAEAVSLFIRISGANVIASPTNLQGRVTVSLKDVDWKTALGDILSLHGLMLTESKPGSSVYTIAPPRPPAEIPLFTETFDLKYVRAETLTNGVTRIVSPNGSLLQAGGKTISILGTSKQVKDVSDLISKLDRMIAQVSIEAKFVELNDQAIKDLGINWQSLENYTLSAKAPTINYARTETVNGQHMESYGTIDANVDSTTGSKSSTKSRVNDATPTTTESSANGKTSSALGAGMAVNGMNFTDFKQEDGALTMDGLVPKKTIAEARAMSAILGAEDFAMTLSALQSNGGAEIITNPKVVVSSGEKATIHVGTKQPNIVRKTNSTQGGTAEVTYEFGEPAWIDIGAKVEVTASVNTESNITVRIAPELDRQVGTVEPTPGLTYPVLVTRRIESEFVLQSGQTVGIGGLTTTEDVEKVTKIPFLGDIPIIGKYLFSHTHTEKSQDETIIFVSVSVVKPESMLSDTGIPSQGRLINERFDGPLSGKLQLRNRGSKPAKADPTKADPMKAPVPAKAEPTKVEPAKVELTKGV